jgi:hypothetical protein
LYGPSTEGALDAFNHPTPTGTYEAQADRFILGLTWAL